MTAEAEGWAGKRTTGQIERKVNRERPWVGPIGHLFLLLWTLSLVLLAPPERTFLAAAIALLAGLACQQLKSAAGPATRAGAPGFRRYRWLFFAALMTLPTLVSAVEIGPGWQPRVASWAALADGARMVVRAVVIMVAVNRFAGAVSIGEVAAFFERTGIQGLGFALGVAVNLLSILRQTMRSTWDSMRMRGGFRRHRLRLFLTTLVYTTLRPAEEIALAAETRAYSPQNAHPAPLSRGSLDGTVIVAGSGLFLALLLL